MIWGFPIGQIITLSGLHFVLGFGVGLLVFWLTLTIFWRTTGLSIQARRGNIGRCIFLWLSGLVASASIVIHVLEDWLIGWF